MDVERTKLRGLSPLDQPRSPEELRIRQLRARDMLRGDIDDADLDEYVESRVMSMVSARYDTARFGAEVFRASPRQADMLILSGRVSIKMVPVIRRIYDQMLEPKWVISMGACSSSGGMFANYAVVQGADKFVPVDIHVPGCPPRPEALIYGILKLQRKIFGDPDLGWRERYNAYGTEEDERPSKAGPLSVQRVGAAPSDGIVESHGSPPSDAELHAPISHPELSGHEAHDAWEEAADDERVTTSRPPGDRRGDA